MNKALAGGAALVMMALLAASCSSDSAEDSTPSTTAGSDATASTETTVPAPTGSESLEAREVVETLASDEFAGRDNGTEGSVLSQDFIIDLLDEFAEPMSTDTTGPDAYRQEFDGGTNILGIIPGDELADEYVVVGAHYDHLGNDCTRIPSEPDDDICNGATDNAAGVAAALDIGRSIAADDDPARRSVIFAFWDIEEDSLGGSLDFVENAPVPLEDIVGYVNFDIQGANLSPGLADSTVMVGAETGGPNLIASAAAATEASTLNTVALSLLFGQGRSDHANFASAGVPSVFFTDANPPCYHTTGDDPSIVDYDKLAQQTLAAEALTRDLLTTDDVPVHDPNAPAASFNDAVSMLDIVSEAEGDFDRFSAEDQELSEQFLADIGAVVDAGSGEFDDAAIQTLLGGSVDLVTALATGECEGFLD